jgi:hypothetical protein
MVGFIPTASGGVFDFDRKDNDIGLKDVSVPLSKACRYTGATVGLYSVAHHTVLLYRWLKFAPLVGAKGWRSEKMQLVLEEFRAYKPAEQLAILQQVMAHDMPEAFVCDVARPVKRHLEPYYSVMEQVAYASIANRWRFLPAVLKNFHPIVWAVDNAILVDEITQILTPLRPGIDAKYDYQLEQHGGPLGIVVNSQASTTAEVQFRRSAKRCGYD